MFSREVELGAPASGVRPSHAQLRELRLEVLLAEAERREAGRLARGLGCGEGESYRAGLHVREFASIGCSRRFPVFGMGWLHTTFSNLEADVLLNICWDDGVHSVKEQLPMSVRRTVGIAAGLGKPHPRTKKGGLKLMTLDFLVGHANAPAQRAISVKPPWKLVKPHEQTKLEIERRYSAEETWDYKVKTGASLDRVLTDNLRLLSPFFFLDPPPGHAPDTVARAAAGLWKRLQADGPTPLSAVCVEVGLELGLPRGFCQDVAWHQFATKRWVTDLGVPLDLGSFVPIVAGASFGDFHG